MEQRVRKIVLIALLGLYCGKQQLALADGCAKPFRLLEKPDITTLVSTEYFPISEPTGSVRSPTRINSIVGKIKNFESSHHFVQVMTTERRPIFTKEFERWLEGKSGVDKDVLNKLIEYSKTAFENSQIGTSRLQKMYRDPSLQGKIKRIIRLHSFYGKGGYPRFMKNAMEAVNFANSQFVRRNWKKEFFDELQSFAVIYWRNSSYVIVREKLPNGQAGEIVGTFRLITGSPSVNKFREEDSKFIFFNRRIQTPLPAVQFTSGAHSNQELIEALEPGVLAIKKGSHPDTWMTLMNQMLTLVFNPAFTAEHNFNRRRLFTFGTEKSIRLLRPLFGFEPTKNPPRKKYGEDWFLLRTTPQKFTESILKNSLYQTSYGQNQLIQLFQELNGYEYANIIGILKEQ